MGMERIVHKSKLQVKFIPVAHFHVSAAMIRMVKLPIVRIVFWAELALKRV
jgi:hypothetical protein